MGQSNGIRWGLVLLAVLVGVVAVFRGVGWYFDPLRDIESFPRPTVVEPEQDATERSVTAEPATLPAATAAELALLESSDVGNQRKGAETLMTRAMTPEVESAVDAALARHPDPQVAQRLVCVKARSRSPETLEFLLARLPTDRRALDWTLAPDVACVLGALAERADDDPDRIVAALTPALYATNLSTRKLVHEAFRTVELEEIPTTLLVEAMTSGRESHRQFMALEGAMALGAIRLNPELVARALEDSSLRQHVSFQLLKSTHPNAARLIANAYAENEMEHTLRKLVRDRENEMRDASAAFLEIVADESASDAKRAAAARSIEYLNEIGPLRELRQVLADLDDGSLKTAVESAVAKLDTRQKHGARERMRALPQ
jgi:hypothetical protein